MDKLWMNWARFVLHLCLVEPLTYNGVTSESMLHFIYFIESITFSLSCLDDAHEWNHTDVDPTPGFGFMYKYNLYSFCCLT